jgi:hypothetical protein
VTQNQTQLGADPTELTRRFIDTPPTPTASNVIPSHQIRPHAPVHHGHARIVLSPPLDLTHYSRAQLVPRVSELETHGLVSMHAASPHSGPSPSPSRYRVRLDLASPPLFINSADALLLSLSLLSRKQPQHIESSLSLSHLETHLHLLRER